MVMLNINNVDIDFGHVIFDISEFEKRVEPNEELYTDFTTQSGIFKTLDGTKFSYQYDTDLFIRRILD